MATTPPSGWYADPVDAMQWRYWDGQQWTGHVAPRGEQRRTRRGRNRKPKFKPAGPLVEATYRMLFADRAMIALLFAGGVVSAAVAALIVVPAMHWGHVTPGFSVSAGWGVVVAGAALGASSFVTQLVTGAVVAAALLRAEGQPVDVRRAMAIAWGRRRQLLAWAAVSTVVGAVTRFLDRFGIGGVVAALTVNLGWAVATVFAVPTLIVEGTMPVATIRRSAGLVKRHFAVTLVSNVTLALPWMAAVMVCLTLGIAGAVTLALGAGAGSLVVGALLLAVGAVGFCFCCTVAAALSSYLEALLYRYANGQPIPGIDPYWLPPRLAG
jgi:hypothetical protein